MKGVLLGADGRYEPLAQRATGREAGPESVVESIMRFVDEAVTYAGDVVGIGLVVPGLVDDDAGVAIYSENVGWRDVPFRALVATATGLPVGFGHDVRAGGNAERVFGAARGERDVLFLPIGTGISGAMVIDGHAVANRFAGEIGHIDVGSGLRCACGDAGCLETVSTGPSIARAYSVCSGRVVSGAKEVFDAARSGDADAVAVIDTAIGALATALKSFTTLLAPELIVVGGGVAGAGDQLLVPLEQRLHAQLVWQRPPQVVGAALGEWAASLGAALLAIDTLLSRQAASA